MGIYLDSFPDIYEIVNSEAEGKFQYLISHLSPHQASSCCYVYNGHLGTEATRGIVVSTEELFGGSVTDVEGRSISNIARKP